MAIFAIVRRVSVIVPFYNVEKWIADCYESLRAQSFRDFEVIFVDDASPDGSASVLERLLEKDHRPDNFRVVRLERNGGLSAARNAGVRSSSGEYVYFMDSDDTLPPDSLEHLVALADRYPGVDLVQGNCRPGHPDFDWLDISGRGFPEFSSDHEWIYSMIIKFEIENSIPANSCNKLIRRDLFLEKSMWFREGIIHEDEYWRFSNAANIRSVAFCLDLTYNYRIRNDSIMGIRKDSDRSPLSLLTMVQEVFPSLPVLNEENSVDLAKMLIWLKRYPGLHNPFRFNLAYSRILRGFAFHCHNFPAKLRKLCLYLSLPAFLVSRRRARRFIGA